MQENLPKFILGKEKLELILSCQRPSLNKNRLRFKKNRKSSRGVGHKKKNRTIYKYTHCKIFDYLESFCLEIFYRSRGDNLRPYRITNAPGHRKIWYQR